jgi:hypothetical protein
LILVTHTRNFRQQAKQCSSFTYSMLVLVSVDTHRPLLFFVHVMFWDISNPTVES